MTKYSKHLVRDFGLKSRKKTSELKLKSYKLNPQKLMFLKGLRTSNPCGPPQLLVWAVLEAVQGREAREKVSLGLSFIGLPDEQPRCMIKMIWVAVWAPCHLQPMVWVPFPPSRAEQYLWGLVLVAWGMQQPGPAEPAWCARSNGSLSHVWGLHSCQH